MAATSTTNRESTPGRRGPSTRRRLWLFRLAAICLGIAPFLAFEGLCRLFDWGQPPLHDDPFVGFDAVRPLFVRSEDGRRYEIPPARQNFFRPDAFAAAKGEDEFRIFCLGGSTVQGRPFRIETSFTTWLEICLNAADPSRRYEVVNCGGVSYASYRLLPILKEVLQHEPDLILVYTGHNEFLERRTFEHLQDRGALLNETLAGASRLRSFTLLREGVLRLQGRSSDEPPRARPMLPAEVDALLDYRGGLEEYDRDEPWRAGVVQQYRYNLGRMVQLAREAEVPLLLINPVSNFRDCPPFKSLHADELPAAELAKWRSLCREASAQLTGETADPLAAVDLYKQACELDPKHAGGWYNLGQCYDAAGRIDDARAAYLRAKDEDICPLRILEPMNQAVLEIAETTGTPVVDAQALFESRSRDGIVGGRWLLDHVHPGIEGHQMLADTLADKLVAIGFVEPGADWKAAKKHAYREHFEALPELYFHEGSQRLEAVRLWAQGRTTRLRGEPDASPE